MCDIAGISRRVPDHVQQRNILDGLVQSPVSGDVNLESLLSSAGQHSADDETHSAEEQVEEDPQLLAVGHSASGPFPMWSDVASPSSGLQLTSSEPSDSQGLPASISDHSRAVSTSAATSNRHPYKITKKRNSSHLNSQSVDRKRSPMAGYDRDNSMERGSGPLSPSQPSTSGLQLNTSTVPYLGAEDVDPSDSDSDVDVLSPPSPSGASVASRGARPKNDGHPYHHCQHHHFHSHRHRNPPPIDPRREYVDMEEAGCTPQTLGVRAMNIDDVESLPSSQEIISQESPQSLIQVDNIDDVTVSSEEEDSDIEVVKVETKK